MSSPTPVLQAGDTAIVADGPRVRRITLGRLLNSGGAGSIHLIDTMPDSVAKIYHPDQDLGRNETKLVAMLELVPDLPPLVEGGQTLVQIAWPTALVRDRAGTVRGFVMPKLDIAATIELEYMLQERQARAHALPTGLGARMTLAANLCAVIAELHHRQHYVVDMKPVNLRFYKRSLHLAVLDCDGFSVHGGGHARFHAQQFTPDYLAPEFHRGGISEALESQQDRFALAVIVFQLLNFGLHPYSGRPGHERVPTDIPGRIARRCYPYGLQAHPDISPSPGSGHTLMPLALRHLFDRAFAGHESARPSAADWTLALRPYAQRASGQLVICAQNSEHQHYAGLACAACARLDLRRQVASTAPQPVHTHPTATPIPAATPAAKRKRRKANAAPNAAQNIPQATAATPLPKVGRPLVAPVVSVPPHSPLVRTGISATVWVVRLVWIGLILLILARCTFGGGTPAVPAQASSAQTAPIKPPVVQPPTPRPEKSTVLLNQLIRNAADGDAARVRQALDQLRTRAQMPRPPINNPTLYSAAYQQYRDVLMSRSRASPEHMTKYRDALKLLYRADPFDPAIAAEFGMNYLMHAGRLSNLSPESSGVDKAELRSLRLEVNNAYRNAVNASPNNLGYWYGLALSCVDLDDEGACATGAFALAHRAVSLTTEAKPAIDPSEFEMARLKLTEFFFTGHRKERLQILRARGQWLAHDGLGGPELSEETLAWVNKKLPPLEPPPAAPTSVEKAKTPKAKGASTPQTPSPVAAEPR